MNMIWPEVFNTGLIPKNMTKEQAIADVCSAWGCRTFEDCKADFGETLVVLNQRFNIDVSPDGIREEANKLLLTLKAK